MSEARASRPRRPFALALAALAMATLIWSSYLLANRIREHHREVDRPLYYVIESDKMDFEFANRRVLISDELNERGEGTLTVQYGDDVLEIPVAIPTELELQGLRRHQDWMRLVIFADGRGLSYPDFRDGIADGSITPRLCVCARVPNPGVDHSKYNIAVDENATRSWGEVMRARWKFDLYEFMPEGGFEQTIGLKYPESSKSFERRRNMADLRGEPLPTRDPGELVEGSWQWQVALLTMPRPPSITFEHQALVSAGWTLPVALGSVFVLMFSIAFGVAPARRKSA